MFKLKRKCLRAAVEYVERSTKRGLNAPVKSIEEDQRVPTNSLILVSTYCQRANNPIQIVACL